MNFINFFYTRLLFFFVAITISSYSLRAIDVSVPTADPIIVELASLPRNNAYRFNSISSIGFPNSKLVITDYSNLWIFDGQNWEKLSYTNSIQSVTGSEGKIFIASGNRIEMFEAVNNGLVRRHLLLNPDSLDKSFDVSKIKVGPNNNLYITTPQGLWRISDRLEKVDSSDAWITLMGNHLRIFYFKADKGIFTLSVEDSIPRPLINSSELIYESVADLFEYKDDFYAISRNAPWFIPVRHKKNDHFNEVISYLSSINCQLKKTYIQHNQIYILTKANDVIIISKSGKLISHIRAESHPLLEQTLDILPYSADVLLFLTPTSILSTSTTDIAGIYRANSGSFGIPISILFSQGYLYSATKGKAFSAKYYDKAPSNLVFKELEGTYGPISQFYNFKSTTYALGSQGVYKVIGQRVSKHITPKNLSNTDFTNFAEIDNELWVVASKDTTFISCCISNSKMEPKSIPYPIHNNSIERMNVFKDNLFVLATNGRWYTINLGGDNNRWIEMSLPKSLDGNIYIPESNNQRPYFNLNGNLFHYDYLKNSLGEHLVFDSTCHLSPLFETDTTLVVKRFLNQFPDVYSIWLYKQGSDFSGREILSPLASLPSTEMIKEGILLPDSTLFLTSSTGLYYFSNIRKTRGEPIISIYKAILYSSKDEDNLIDGYLSEGEDIKNSSFASNNRNLKVTFASNGSTLWNLGLSSVQFSSFLEGFEKKWTPWTTSNTREINSLDPGNYTLRVKSKNFWGDESSEARIEFTIKPRFFETTLFIIALSIWGILGLFLFFRWRQYSYAKVRHKLESLINQRTEELVIEKEKTDNLLARVLPKDTASELKEKGRVNTQRFQVVTVLFCDIEGFTRITDETNPEILIDQLDKFFLYFDSVVEKYRIEKIKTIGDAYMCAGGIPKKNRTNPVEVVLAALEMMSYMKDLTTHNANKSQIWELRIGIDTGPVIAGVVGRNKLSYDIWGSTVNTASRMESSGEAGQINISGNTFMLVKDYFICNYRGKMPVKNKGDIQMYFVNGIKPELSEGMNGLVLNNEFRIQLQLIRLGDLEDFVLEKLEKGLPKTLYYHNLKHTVDVYTQVELIGRAENVSKEELLLLRTAALFHDAGHLIDYNTHEEMAVKLVREILPEYQYTERQIEIISSLIMSTKMPPMPKNLLEEIMCDADLDYLGRPDFIPVSNNLYKELHEHGKVGTLREWNELQIKFIDKHSYFTKTARRLRNVNKQSQLDKLKAWMEKN